MSQTEEQEQIENDKVRLRKNGDLYQRGGGHDTVIAHYDRNSGHLEFENREYSIKFYQRCVERLGTVNDGKDVSTLVVRTFGIKGEKRADTKKLPPKPRLGPLGDASEDYVRWYLENDLPGAIIRYRIYTDENGQPIRKDVRRLIVSTIDDRLVEDKRLPWRDIGEGQEKGPIAREGEYVYEKNAIIARRATALTFLPTEVQGGFQPNDDFEDVPVDQTEDAQ